MEAVVSEANKGPGGGSVASRSIWNADNSTTTTLPPPPPQDRNRSREDVVRSQRDELQRRYEERENKLAIEREIEIQAELERGREGGGVDQAEQTGAKVDINLMLNASTPRGGGGGILEVDEVVKQLLSVEEGEMANVLRGIRPEALGGGGNGGVAGIGLAAWHAHSSRCLR